LICSGVVDATGRVLANETSYVRLAKNPSLLLHMGTHV
jgi:hypothetical protein